MSTPHGRTVFSLALGLSALAAVSLPTNHATACSIACAAGDVHPRGGNIPGDQIRFRYDPISGKSTGSIDGGTSLPRLYRVVGPARVEVALRVGPSDTDAVWITPDEPVPVGTQLVLEAPSCGNDPLRGEYTITAPAAFPTELGTLQTKLKRENLRVAVVNGSCSLPADIAYADLTVQLAESARPFADVLDYEVSVDGKPYPDFSTALAAPTQLPQGEKRIYAACRVDSYFKSDAALTPGVHRVQLRAKVDGKELSTPEIVVDLSCTGTPPAWEPDSDLPQNLRPSAHDGGTASGVDGGSGDEPRNVFSDDSGCSLADSSSRMLPGWLVLLALALTSRRRRQPSEK